MRRKDKKRMVGVVNALHRVLPPRETAITTFDGINDVSSDGIAFQAFGGTPGVPLTYVAAWPVRDAWHSRLVLFDPDGKYAFTRNDFAPVELDHRAAAYIVSCGLSRLRSWGDTMKAHWRDEPQLWSPVAAALDERASALKWALDRLSQ